MYPILRKSVPQKRCVHLLYLIFLLTFVIWCLLYTERYYYSSVMKMELKMTPTEAPPPLTSSSKILPLQTVEHEKQTIYGRNITPPGVLLQVKGGIGNQLFQYACSYALAKDLNWPLYIFQNPFFPIGPRMLPSNARPFILDKFKIPLNLADQWTKLHGQIINLHDKTFLERNFLQNRTGLDNTFLQLGPFSYCQSFEYFWKYQKQIETMFHVRKSAIRQDKLKDIMDKIKMAGESSVAVHLRIGDFASDERRFIPLSYHRRALRKMAKMLESRENGKPVFFVFSDKDVRNVTRKLEDFGKEAGFELVFVSRTVNGSSLEEFFLMTLCKHIILPNSTFSWWAAFLIENPNKIVIASVHHPKYLDIFGGRSVFNEMLYLKMMYPKEWIVINPFIGGLAI